MKEKRRFKLQVRATGLIEILDRVVVEGKKEPTLFKFRLPKHDGYEFREKFEALKQDDIIFLEFSRTSVKSETLTVNQEKEKKW